MKICIAVCAKNEENTIISTLNSLLNSAKRLENVVYYFHVCINGSQDKTLDLVKSWGCNREGFIVNELVNANLVEAQRIIVDASKELSVDALAFFDADIIVDVECLKYLVKKINEPNVMAAYAISIPKQIKTETLVEKVLNQYDLSPTIFTQRYHLHGRAFIIKDWNVPKLPIPLLVDDIYLSFYLLFKYGVESIKKVEEAKVYFYQVNNYSDYFKVYKRRNKEIYKCLSLFPEFSKLPREWVDKRILYNKILKESNNRILLWFIYFSLRFLAKIQFKVENILLINNNNFWEVSVSSKKLRTKPFIVLFEGLDCSGKKTLSKLVESELIKKGLAATVNSGPLGGGLYKKIIQLVSIHSFPNFIRSIVYAFNGLGDYKLSKRFNSDIILQVSSPYRSVAYSKVTKNWLRIVINKFLKGQFVRYDLVYYLNCNYNERIKRHKYQMAMGLNNDNVKKRFSSENFFQKNEMVLLEVLSNSYATINKYDTTNIDLKVTAKEIVVNIINKL